jgi:hypothetical protein
MSADDIAHHESSDPAATFRLLRACASLGLLAYDAGTSKFSGTPLLATLRSGSPTSLREFALALAAPGHWQSWGRFPTAVRSGERQPKAALGTELFAYFEQHKDEAALFSAAMTGLSTPVAREAVSLIDTAGTDLVADIGGANGAFVLELLTRHPGLQGLIFDLPHVASTAADEVARRKMQDRCSVAGGDFFVSVPAADLYLLKFVLHDWDDDACVAILGNCRSALKPGGRVIVVDMLVSEVGEPGFGPLMDMNMLVLAPGRERNLSEFDRLLRSAGLRRVALTPLQPPYSIIEAMADSE